MNPNPGLEPQSRWLWWICGTVFLLGAALGWRAIRTVNGQLPVSGSLPRFERVDLSLNHPLPGTAAPATAAGNLRLWLYSGHELAGPPLATAVEPPAFDRFTPWLRALFDKRLARDLSDFSVKMRGWIVFSSPYTIVHLRSEKGYRIRFRNALGEEQRLEHWVDNWVEDAGFGAVVAPGRYEIEIDYFNIGDGGYFEMWGSPRVEFEPATDPPAAAR